MKRSCGASGARSRARRCASRTRASARSSTSTATSAPCSRPTRACGASSTRSRPWRTRARRCSSPASGTGRDAARPRRPPAELARAGPFVEVNCGALPSALLEEQLFGHVRGAPSTGAVRRPRGQVRAGRGRTILLDEIGAASTELQLKLLRVLEEGRYERVGDTRTRTVDARVIAATNVDLEGGSRPDASAPTSSTASTCSPSRSRRCASAWPTSAARAPLLRALRACTAGRCRGSGPGDAQPLQATPGPATCASWRTPSSAPCW